LSAVSDSRELSGEDGQLVDLVSAVLVDPNLHTDMRMRLQREISSTLSTAYKDLYGQSGSEPHPHPHPHPRPDPDPGQANHVSALLTAVLVDPNLHTDMRLRLHREITEMLRDVPGGGR
jgi:hypothetical protein